MGLVFRENNGIKEMSRPDAHQAVESGGCIEQSISAFWNPPTLTEKSMMELHFHLLEASLCFHCDMTSR
jgi:hypothetical protein